MGQNSSIEGSIGSWCTPLCSNAPLAIDAMLVTASNVNTTDADYNGDAMYLEIATTYST